MKRSKRYFLGLVMCCLSLTPLASEAAKQIYTCLGLKKINDDLTGSYELAQDIDCSSDFMPIGYDDKPFSGKFDGKGHKIMHLHINMHTENQKKLGLFSTTKNATIENVTIDDLDVLGSDDTGGLIGQARDTQLRNIKIQGQITTIDRSHGIYELETVGGLAGDYQGGLIENCSVDVNILSDFPNRGTAGGLVGFANNITVKHSNAKGSLTIRGNAEALGGLIGESIVVTLDDCYATGHIDATYLTSNCFLGGFIGYAFYQTITHSYATGSINTNKYHQYLCGGFIGRAMDINIHNSYAAGNVDGCMVGAGFVGSWTPARKNTIANSYSKGMITGGVSLGGFIAKQSDPGVIKNSYWDIETSTQSESLGGEGKTTLEMCNRDTYQGWDFDHEWISQDLSYPGLR